MGIHACMNDHCSYMHEFPSIHSYDQCWSSRRYVDRSHERLLIIYDHIHNHVIMKHFMTPTWGKPPFRVRVVSLERWGLTVVAAAVAWKPWQVSFSLCQPEMGFFLLQPATCSWYQVDGYCSAPSEPQQVCPPRPLPYKTFNQTTYNLDKFYLDTEELLRLTPPPGLAMVMG